MTEARQSEDRKGRGRLSSIDLLPPEADEAVAWAKEQLRERKMAQKDIWRLFNEQLAELYIDPISKSAFNRYAIRKALLWRRLDETRNIASEVCQSLGTDDSDELTILVAEMIKLAVFERLETGDSSEKGLAALSSALERSTKARDLSRADRAKRIAEENANKAKVADALGKAEQMVSEAGLSADRIAQLRRDFLGVREEKSA